jgi:hypothetical protein
MSVYVVGLLWVLGAGIVSAAIAFLVHGRHNATEDADGNSPVGAVFSLVAGLHAVLMVFVLIGLFDAAGNARADTYREADGLVAVAWAGDSLPAPARDRIDTLSRTYANTVIEREWPRMRLAEKVDTSGWSQLNELRMTIEQANAADDWQQARKAEAAEQLWEIYQARQARLNASDSGVGIVVWFALALGSIATVALPYLFSGAKLTTYVAVVATMAGMVALLLFAISQMQNPFSGGASVDPDAFRSALDRIG